MKKVTLVLCLILSCAFDRAHSSEIEYQPFTGCPKYIPVTSASLSLASVTSDGGVNRFEYLLSNYSVGDSIDRVELLGIPSDSTGLAPIGWIPWTAVKNIFGWLPSTPYTGNSSLMGTTLPSDAALPGGASKNGFQLKSKLPTGLLVYRLGTSHPIDSELRAFDQWRGSSNHPVESDEDYESWAEEYSVECGATIGIDRRLMVTGVVSGPSRYPVGSANIIPDPAVPSAKLLQVIPPAESLRKVGLGSSLSIYNAENNKKIPITSSVIRDRLGLPLFSAPLPVAEFSALTCRTRSVLVEAVTDGEVIFRAKIDGDKIGLPAVCSR